MSSVSSSKRASQDAFVRVWDLPTRLFHWILAILAATLYLTAQLDAMKLHVLCGQAVLVLVLFRIAWGIFGSSTSRFSNFVRSPIQALAYLKSVKSGHPPLYAGHNPAGGWMIVFLLAGLAIQAGSGLFSRARSAAGPLADLISPELSRAVSEFHGAFFTLLALAVGLHVAAAFAYLFFLRENLILPLVTGKKPAALTPKGERPHLVSPLWALLVLFLAVAVVFLPTAGL